MNNVLMMLQAREIPSVMDAVAEINISKVFFKGFTELQLWPLFNEFVKDTDYDNYIIAADDIIFNQYMTTCIEDSLEDMDLVTGYCDLYQGSEHVNICKTPLKSTNTYPDWPDYDFYTLEEIRKLDNFQPSWFGGWALTGISRGVLLDNPIRVHPVGTAQSDYVFSYDMTHNKNRIFTVHKEVYPKHLKEGPEAECRQNWLVGKTEPRIIHDSIC